MKAIILAAGRSRRLFPITHRKPKCLLQIGAETLIDRLLRILRDAGVIDVVLVTGFRANKLQTHVLEHQPNTTFTFIENTEYATTLPAFGLWMARDHLHEDVLYLNSDILCDSRIIQEIVAHKHESVTAIQRTPWDEEEVNVVFDTTGRVTKLGKQISSDESEGEFLGVTKLSKHFNVSLLNALQAFESMNDRQKFAADAINLAVQNGGELYAHDVSHYKACEIDTVADYTAAQELSL